MNSKLKTHTPMPTHHALTLRQLAKLCGQMAHQLQHSPGDLLYDRYQKADALRALLTQLGHQLRPRKILNNPKAAIAATWS